MSVADFLTRYEGLMGRLPGDTTLRSAAAEAFRAAGLPGGTSGRRVEAWKYTSLRAVAEAAFGEGPKHEAETAGVCRWAVPG
jgi:Fe-S cluster assembly protein SufD